MYRSSLLFKWFHFIMNIIRIPLLVWILSVTVNGIELKNNNRKILEPSSSSSLFLRRIPRAAFQTDSFQDNHHHHDVNENNNNNKIIKHNNRKTSSSLNSNFPVPSQTAGTSNKRKSLPLSSSSWTSAWWWLGQTELSQRSSGDNTNKKTKNKLCLDVLCQPDEYCFVPELGQAVCLKRNNQNVWRPTVKKFDYSEPEQEKKDYYKSQQKTFDSGGRQQNDSSTIEKKKKRRINLKKLQKNLQQQESNGDNDKFKWNNNSNEMDNEIGRHWTSSKLDIRKKYPKYNNNNKIIQCPSCPLHKNNSSSNNKIIKKRIICGSDNSTYSSMCRIDFHNCIHGTDVKFSCFGFCPCDLKKNFFYGNTNDLKLEKFHQQQHPERKIDLKQSLTTKPKTTTKTKTTTAMVNDPNIMLAKKSENGGHNNENGDLDESSLLLTKQALNQYHYNVVVVGDNQTDIAIEKESPSSSSMSTVTKKHCTTEDLRSMGFRLLDWFSVVMKEEIKHKKFNSTFLIGGKFFQKQPIPLPDCEESVSFMFYHFDIDKNFKLSDNELYYLVHDDNEYCLEPYLKKCDEDENNFLSAYEWCSCFSLRSKPCLYHLKHLNNENEMIVGRYVPQCDQNGQYRNVQCQSVTGNSGSTTIRHCWCSDKNGNEIAGTRVRGRIPKCDKIYPLNRSKFVSKTINNNESNIRKKIATTRTPTAFYVNDFDDDNDDDDDDDDDDEDNFNLDHGSGNGFEF